MIASKLVTIESSGKINELGGINGPITSPCRLEIRTIISLINSGKVVYEVNPSNKKEKIRLTRLNVNVDNFVKEPVKPVTPKVETKFNYKHDNKTNNEKTESQNKGEKLTGVDAFVSNKKS